MMNRRNLVLLFLLTPILLTGLIALYLWGSVPREQIDQLKTGYVQRVEDGKIEIVQQRPKDWIELGQLDQKVVMAFVISEDWSFFEHGGVDWQQVHKAVRDSFKSGERLRGASTLSQQVVKNLFLSPERSFWRKLKELVITLHLEEKLEKEKILEVYLNIVELGEGIYGIEAASKAYFKLSATQLNVREAAFLAMLLPSPVRYSQSYKDRKLTDYAASTIESILEKLRVQGTLTQEESSHARSAPLRFDGRDPRRVKRAQKTTLLPGRLDDDGSAFERAEYQVDQDLGLDTGPSFDPNALAVPEGKMDVEFSLE